MSLRFNRNVTPTWNGRRSRIEFECEDPRTRSSVRCAVSRAALEDVNGLESLDGDRCLAVVGRRLARILEAADSVYSAGRLNHGIVLVDSDDLLAQPVYH